MGKREVRAWVHLNCPVSKGLEATLKRVRKKRSKDRRKAITDSYVRQVLCDRTSLTFKDIPQELIDAKRELIKLSRKLKKGKHNEINEGCKK